jgi:hypothetical protein
MNPQDWQQEEKLQDAAENAERERLPAGDPNVDAYRLVLRALKRPLPIALPADFAQQVVRKLQAREEAASVERWLTNAVMVTMAISAVFFALPPLASALAPVFRATVAEPVPWSLILVAGLGLAAVWLTDSAVLARRR